MSDRRLDDENAARIMRILGPDSKEALRALGRYSRLVYTNGPEIGRGYLADRAIVSVLEDRHDPAA